MKTKRMSLYIVSVVLLVIMILGSLGVATWALLSTKLDVSGNIGFQGTGDVLATISNGTCTGGTVTQKDGKTPMQQVDITATGPSDSTSWVNLDLVIADKTEPLVISFSVTNNQPAAGNNLEITVDAGIATKNNITIAATTTEFGDTNPVVLAPGATAHYSITFTVPEGTNTILSRDFTLTFNLVNNVPPIYIREGDYIYFGSYAKTIKANDVTVSSTADANGYYTGSDGEKYVKIIATPCETGYKFSDNTTITANTEYYFKVEAIKWKVLSETAGSAMLLAEDILAAQAYDASGDSNYKDSDIRAWLNGTFLTTAFTAAEQGIIQTTEVDNSAETTDSSPHSHACENTNDKVYLLSYQDLKNTAYFADDAARKKAPTDYAKATGAYWYVDFATGFWWSRSPHSYRGGSAWLVNIVGMLSSDGVIDSSYGAVPALTIAL